jgi:hypothetical protein
MFALSPMSCLTEPADNAINHLSDSISVLDRELRAHLHRTTDWDVGSHVVLRRACRPSLSPSSQKGGSQATAGTPSTPSYRHWRGRYSWIPPVRHLHPGEMSLGSATVWILLWYVLLPSFLKALPDVTLTQPILF